MQATKAASFVSVSQLTISDAFQMRERLDSAVVREYGDLIEANDGEWPFAEPCHVVRVKNDLLLVDGFHRVAALKQCGEDQVLVLVTDGTRLDALKAALQANSSHGLKVTNADKRKKVRSALADSTLAKWSDRKLADLCGVSNDFVGRVRAEVSSDDTSAPAANIGSDGKTYPATKQAAEQQREAIAEKIADAPDKSNRAIAAEIGCDDKTVAAVRQSASESAVATGEQPDSDTEPEFDVAAAMSRLCHAARTLIRGELSRWPEDMHFDCLDVFSQIVKEFIR